MATRKPRGIRRTWHNSRARGSRKLSRSSRKWSATTLAPTARSKSPPPESQAAEQLHGKVAGLKAQGESD